MPNDAKLGLVVGVGLVIGVAMVYFRKDLPEAPPEASYTAPVSSTRATPANPRGTYRQVRAKAVTQGEEAIGDEENRSVGSATRSNGGQEGGVRYLPPFDRPYRLP
jgi:hypothetical protein